MFSLAGILNVLINLVNVVVPVVGLIAIAAKASGTARKLGIAGCAVLAGTGLLQTIWIFAAPQLMRRSGASIAVTYGVVGALLTILGAVGLLLLIAAVVSGRSGPRVAPPGPYQQYPQGPSAGPPPGSGNGWS